LLELAAGYYGGRTDRIVGRTVDTIMAFPLFVLAMGIVAALSTASSRRQYRLCDRDIVYATAIINLPIYALAALRQVGQSLRDAPPRQLRPVDEPPDAPHPD
jgi:peptide/nickel transport system permease protein